MSGKYNSVAPELWKKLLKANIHIKLYIIESGLG